MAETETASGPVLAVFADATQSGDAEYTRVLSSAGTLFARNGAHLICLVVDGAYCRPLVTSACAAGGAVTLLSDGSLDASLLAEGCTVETIEDEEARFQRLGDMADALVGFPAGLMQVRALFNAWVMAGGGASGKPVALLNRNRAYEVLRGYLVDVVTHSLADSDRLTVFADTVEDLWAKLQHALETD